MFINCHKQYLLFYISIINITATCVLFWRKVTVQSTLHVIKTAELQKDGARFKLNVACCDIINLNVLFKRTALF